MRSVVARLGIVAALAAGAGCDSGFGVGIDIDPGCAANGDTIQLFTKLQPGGQEDTKDVAAKDLFVSAGKGRVVILPPDGTTGIEMKITIFQGASSIANETLEIPVQGHQLLEHPVVFADCQLLGDGGSDGTIADFSMPDIAARCTPAACTGTAGTPVCDPASGRCVGCVTDDDCGSGSLCGMDQQCAPGCAPGHPCEDAGTCINVMCGRCGGDGGPNFGCSAPTPFCDGATGLCVGCNNNSDCGGNRQCLASGGGRICVDQCTVPGDCKTKGTTCCNNVCIDVTGDPNNCGGCNSVCPIPKNAQSAACSNSVCGLGQCKPGFADCDGQLANGCEIETDDDLMNCKMCGFACSFPNATPVCSGGMCKIQSCTGSYQDCDGLLLNGCESDVLNDPANCGSCGAACMVMHAVPRCASGQCDIGFCDNGWGNCNNLANDGCEVPLNTTANCGACNRTCLAPQNGNATAICDGNLSCQVVCNPGFADCNGVLADGCETNILTDPSHCGSCAATNCLSCTQGACGMVPPKCNPTQCTGGGIDPQGGKKFTVCRNAGDGIITVSGVAPGDGFYVDAVCKCLSPQDTSAAVSSAPYQCNDQQKCPSAQQSNGQMVACVNGFCTPFDQKSYLVWNCK